MNRGMCPILPLFNRVEIYPLVVSSDLDACFLIGLFLTCTPEMEVIGTCAFSINVGGKLIKVRGALQMEVIVVGRHSMLHLFKSGRWLNAHER